jgi:hypothetical protein
MMMNLGKHDPVIFSDIFEATKTESEPAEVTEDHTAEKEKEKE